MKSMTALACVAVTGLPPKVEMVDPFNASATSGRATVKPTGEPFPRLLALVMMSGMTPHCSMPNHFPPVRPHPVWTSSLMKRPPDFRTMPAIISKYSLGGVINPPTPCIGSAMNAAMRPEVEVRIISSRSRAQRTLQEG